jgi:hypothetical protein
VNSDVLIILTKAKRISGMRWLIHLVEGAEFPEQHHSVMVVLLIGMFILLSSCNISIS